MSHGFSYFLLLFSHWIFCHTESYFILFWHPLCCLLFVRIKVNDCMNLWIGLFVSKLDFLMDFNHFNLHMWGVMWSNQFTLPNATLAATFCVYVCVCFSIRFVVEPQMFGKYLVMLGASVCIFLLQLGFDLHGLYILKCLLFFS